MKEHFAAILRKSGHKATPGRLSLLFLLASANRPLAIHDIIDESKKGLNQATVYRSLESLLEAGIVRRVDMQHAHAHYELAEGAAHHHHLICKHCGRVEDVENCDVSAIEKTVLKRSKSFASIQTHSLEFFGLCTKCKKRNATS
jgi:Fur family ferric uptake transcriptional regulator